MNMNQSVIADTIIIIIIYRCCYARTAAKSTRIPNKCLYICVRFKLMFTVFLTSTLNDHNDLKQT